MQRHYYDQQFINKAVDQWRPRLQAVIRAHGGHIEQLFAWLSASFWLLYEVVIGHIDTSTHRRLLLLYFAIVT